MQAALAELPKADRVPEPTGLGYMINVASNRNGVGYGKWLHVDGWCPGLISLSVVVQVHPPHPFDCSQHRRAAGPYKLGRPGRLPGTAGFDTQDYNHHARGPREFGDRVTNADRSGSTPLTGANSYPRRRNFGAGPPKAGCECSTHSVGAISPLKHMKTCSALVMRRQLVQIQPSAPVMPVKL